MKLKKAAMVFISVRFTRVYQMDEIKPYRAILIAGPTASGKSALAVRMAQQHGGKDFADPTAKADADKKTIQAQIAAVPKQNGNYAAKLADLQRLDVALKSCPNRVALKSGVNDAWIASNMIIYDVI